MAPALNVNDRVLVLKKLFFSNNIDYGDIIVFYPVDSKRPSYLNILNDSLNRLIDIHYFKVMSVLL